MMRRYRHLNQSIIPLAESNRLADTHRIPRQPKICRCYEIAVLVIHISKKISQTDTMAVKANNYLQKEFQNFMKANNVNNN